MNFDLGTEPCGTCLKSNNDQFFALTVSDWFINKQLPKRCKKKFVSHPQCTTVYPETYYITKLEFFTIL